MKISKEKIAQALSGSISENNLKTQKKLAIFSMFDFLDSNNDRTIDLEEITVFANEILNNCTDKNGHIKKEECIRYIKEKYFVMVDFKSFKNFFKFFIDNQQTDETEYRTDYPDGTYSITKTEDNITKIINFDATNNIKSIEEITGNKTVIKDKQGALLKEIISNGEEIATTEYDNSCPQKIIRKVERNGVLQSYEKSIVTSNNKETTDIYRCENGNISDCPNKTIIRHGGKIVQEILYDENGIVSNIFNYENGKIKENINLTGTSGVKVTNYLGNYQYIQDPSLVLDTVVDNSRQGTTGDCWVLAGLNSLSSTSWGRQAIKDCLKYDSQGNITVTLKGAYGKNKQFTITAQELYEARISGVKHTRGLDVDTSQVQYSEGSATVLAFELAIEKYRQQFGETLDDGGFQEEIARLILGTENTDYYSTSDKAESEKIFSKAEKKPDEYAIAVALEHFDREGNSIGIHQYHFKRIEYENDNKYYILSNPWNSQIEIRMTEEEFYDKFSDVEYIKKPKNAVNQEVQEIDSNSSIDNFKMSNKSNKSAALSVICAFRSNQRGREIMNEIIKKDDDDNLVITLGGKDFKITKYELETARRSGNYADGDDDVIAMEIATERYQSMASDFSYSDSLYKYRVGMETMYSPISMLAMIDKNIVSSALQVNTNNRKLFNEYLEQMCVNPEKYMATAANNGNQTNNCTIKRVEKNAFGEYVIIIVRPEDTSVELQYTYDDFISMYNTITLF